MAKRATPEPFRYRGRWRGQVTLKNGQRPAESFDTQAEAAHWIREQLQNKNAEHEPELGGPKAATVGQAAHRYAHLYTIAKGGVDSELNRINHYLSAVGLPWLRCVEDSEGKKSLEEYELAKQPSGWQRHNDARRAKRAKTYALIEELGRTRCSMVTTAKLRELMTTMKSEGLSDSTIQKEIALLKAMFNKARTEWSWKGFENPCEGLKLGKSNQRFVFLTKAQEAALWKAISECDNPYFWPLVVSALESTQRVDRLLNMTWEATDLEGRVMYGWSKGVNVLTHLSAHLVDVLSHMPQPRTGPVFPMSKNAVKLAWNGVREKAGLPKLQFKDLRHLGATELARRGWSAHALAQQLGHTTTRMASVYVNLAGHDILDLMDRTAKPVPVIQIPPPAAGSANEIQSKRRADRLVAAAKKKWLEEATPAGEQPEPGAETPVTPEQGGLKSTEDSASQSEAVPSAPLKVLSAASDVAAESAPAQTPDESHRGNIIAVNFRRRAA